VVLAAVGIDEIWRRVAARRGSRVEAEPEPSPQPVAV